MKKIGDFFFAQKLTLILVVIFAASIGIATFIEQNHDTETAKMLVYNARWMEMLLFLLVINLIGSIFRRKLYRKEKITIFIFHLGFIVMIIGAGVTRYFGYEGNMHIREGESSNIVYTNDTYLMVNSNENDPKESEDFLIDRKDLTSKPFDFKINAVNKGEFNIKFKDYIYHAEEKIIENQPNGKDMIEIRVAGDMGSLSGVVEEGRIKKIGNLIFAFNNEKMKDAVQIRMVDQKLLISAPFNLFQSANDGTPLDSVSNDSIFEFTGNQIFNGNGTLFMLVKYYKKAKTKLVDGEEESENPDAIIAEVSYKGKVHEVEIFGGDGYVDQVNDFKFDDLSLNISYGNKPIEVPFSIYLEDFVLERYPGSMNPSSFESHVVLIDEKNNVKENFKIYMNNILNYGGYRFFQSSYDRDEQGTVLSVNHDRWGTNITYFSYLLLLLGFLSTFLNKHSRFNSVRKKIAKTRVVTKSVIVLLFMMLGVSANGFSQSQILKPVDKEHADKFGHLIVQTFDGRFEPVHTMAYDVIHKLYKKNSIEVDGKGKLDGMQLYLDLIIDSEFWKNQKIIYIKDESIQNIVGVNGNYASFYDFFSSNGQYKLTDYSQKAFQKSKADQDNFDKEIMKVEERLNILYMSFNGSMLKIFPDPDSKNNKWLSLEDSAAYKPLKGSITAINEDLQLKILSYSSILQLYFQTLVEATMTGNYSRTDQIVGYIHNIQRQTGPQDILPSEAKINTEVHYNKARIFDRLKYVYMILSVFLLLLSFTVHLSAKKNKILNYLLNFLIVVLAAAFLYHIYGLVLRWYLSGHAPWSNGYEVLVFVSCIAILAGFIFMRYSKIALAATALLAFLMLLTAGFSSNDPQLTNLQPVLKSYWLIIHVAVIVISYAVLGLGFVLGFMNLVVYLFKTTKNASRLDQTIKDLTNISEMSLLIGIVMATIGTFLGAIWANESWGRYWGWDAKETWALIILMVYAAVLHLRLIPSLNNILIYNIASVIAFASVIMTFFGVNFYLSKGLHSYGSGSGMVFPLWAWITIAAIFVLIMGAVMKQKKFKGIAEE